MQYLILGLVLFLGIHSTSIFARDFRNRCAAKSLLLWKIGYSVVALIGLYLIVVGYAQARMEPTVLYTPPTWLRHLMLLLMVPVFPLLVAAYVPGKIKSTLKHPMLVAVKLWALSHLLVNGTLADVLLFGGILAWAVVDRISVKRRPGQPQAAAGNVMYDVFAVVVGLALYGFFVMWAHSALIGMPIIPR